MSRHVRVLHVFEAACNLINESGETVSLVSPQIGDGPFNIVVPDVRFSAYVTPADPVACTPDTLIVGRLTVNTRSAHLWNPRPCWESLHADPIRLVDHLPLLLDVLREQAPAGSLAGLLDLTPDLPTVDLSPLQFGEGEGEPPRAARKGVRSTESYSTAMLHAAHWTTHQIITGLRQDDRALCLEGVAGLAGLGGGLTPAGDDWLVGCMLAMWAISARHAIPPTAIAQTAAPRTTPLSAAWLHAAARGECGLPWHTLFSSLVGGSEPSIIQAAESIIHQGHTSGADALAGFAALFYDPH